MRKLNLGHLADRKQAFTLPIDAATETISILGQRGSGKTYTAQDLAEEMAGAGIPFVVLDPLDCWYGLRSSADGKSAGLDVLIVGGEHGDIPLEPTAGAALADFVVEHRVNVIIALRHLSKGKQLQFVADFCARLYHRKGKSEFRDPLHVFIDEADAFAPQRVFPESAKSLGAIDDLVRRGRSSGIGVTLITQRAAAINKDVLSQTETLIAHKTTGPQDRQAIKTWIEAHDTDEKGLTLMSSLAALERGRAWFWSPSRNIFDVVAVRTKLTFDSSSTPKIGEKRIEPKKVSPVDLEKLKAAFANTVKAAEENDPKKLRARIAELEAAAKKAKPVADQAAIDAAYQRGSLDARAQIVKETLEALKDLDRVVRETVRGTSGMISALQVGPVATPPVTPRAPAAAGGFTPRTKPSTIAPATFDGAPKKCERAILQVLAQYPNGRNKTQTALISGYSHNSGSFNAAIAALRAQGLIEGDGTKYTATAAGVKAAGPVDRLPSGMDLVRHWQDELGPCEAGILGLLAACYPVDRSKQAVAAELEYSHNSGSFNAAIAALRKLDLVTSSGDLALNPDIFQE